MNLKVDFLLDDVCGDPRFSALLKKIGLKKLANPTHLSELDGLNNSGSKNRRFESSRAR